MLGKFIASESEDDEDEIEILSDDFFEKDPKLVRTRQTKLNDVTKGVANINQVKIGNSFTKINDDSVVQVPTLEETFFFPENETTGRTDFGETHKRLRTVIQSLIFL